MKHAPQLLRKLADMLDSGRTPPPPTPDYEEKDWERAIFDHTSEDMADFSLPPPPWDDLLSTYRGNPFLDPPPMFTKRRYVYDREYGERAVHREAEEYSDITLASVLDMAIDDLDERLLRKSFDIPMFQTEVQEGRSERKPYTFFLCDVSGSMNGTHSKHALAIAQAAAEKVFGEGGVFVWLPYGNNRKGADEFYNSRSLIEHLKTVSFYCGTTHIGDNLRELGDALSFKIPYKHAGGQYLIPSNCDKSRSKVFVVHDGTDTVNSDMPIRIPVYAIVLGADHEALSLISKKTRGKYWNITKP